VVDVSMGAGIPHKLIDVQVQGGAKAIANLKLWADKMPVVTGDAFLEEMKDTVTEAKAECPYDYANLHLDGTPHLRDTGHSEMGVQNQDQIVVEGAFNTPYAVYVHEILENRHLWPTKAKFLEDPVNRRAPSLMGNIQRKIAGIYAGVL
jgi:hypothetical protein